MFSLSADYHFLFISFRAAAAISRVDVELSRPVLAKSASAGEPVDMIQNIRTPQVFLTTLKKE